MFDSVQDGFGERAARDVYRVLVCMVLDGKIAISRSLGQARQCSSRVLRDERQCFESSSVGEVIVQSLSSSLGPGAARLHGLRM